MQQGRIPLPFLTAQNPGLSLHRWHVYIDYPSWQTRDKTTHVGPEKTLSVFSHDEQPADGDEKGEYQPALRVSKYNKLLLTESQSSRRCEQCMVESFSFKAVELKASVLDLLSFMNPIRECTFMWNSHFLTSLGRYGVAVIMFISGYYNEAAMATLEVPKNVQF